MTKEEQELIYLIGSKIGGSLRNERSDYVVRLVFDMMQEYANQQTKELKAETKENEARISILESLLYSAKQSTSDLDLYKEIETELNN